MSRRLSFDYTKLRFGFRRGTGAGPGRLDRGTDRRSAPSSARERAPGSYNVWLAAPDGSGLVQVTSSRFSDWGHRWSPDGSEIAYTQDYDARATCRRRAGLNEEIYTMLPDGSAVTNRTLFPGADRKPAGRPRP